ncbi:MAG: methionyl-tRNA formyltransferase [Candidatus Omnitrophica bacterium]|nr:methionyl-tRNA formyltransferase [Candidatus Omnitrophota bacterium]
MRFVYFGTSQFAADFLKLLCDKNIIPELVVSTPDVHSGRGLKLQSSPVKSCAAEKEIPCITPQDLSDPRCTKKIQDLGADLFVVVSYGKLIPHKMLSSAGKFPLGVHPSLLPRLRGAAPIQWSLINGEAVTGVTVFVIDEKIDSGPILVQEKLVIHKDDDYFSLCRRLVALGVECIVGALRLLSSEKYELIEQDKAQSTYSRKLKKSDGKINWRKRAKDIVNLIRGTKEWPGAYTFHKGKPIKIIQAVEAQSCECPPSPGIITVKEGMLYVRAGDIAVAVLRLKPAGKKEMPAESFLNGYRVKTGDRFE